MDDPRVFLTTGGGESIDTAAKLARRYWSVRGMPDRAHLISRTAGYHGTNGFGTSLGGIEANRAGFGQLVTETSVVDHESVDALAAEISRLGAEALANLDILERERLVPRGRELEQPLLESLAPLADHELVAEVRGGTGLLAAVELEEPGAVPHLFTALRERGVLARPLARAVAFSPPLTVTREQIRLIPDTIREAP